MPTPASAKPLPMQLPNTSQPIAMINTPVQGLLDSQGKPITGQLNLSAFVTQAWRYYFNAFAQAVNNVWTISGNNIYNSNTGNVGVGTTAPASLLDIEGPNAVFQGEGKFPTVVQVADGSASNPQTSEFPTFWITRVEALNGVSATHNAAIYAASSSDNTGSGQHDGVAIFGFGFQSGDADVSGVIGHGQTQSPSGHVAYGGFFNGESLPGGSAGNSTVGVQANATNGSGLDHSYANWVAHNYGDFGTQLTANGGNLCTAAVFIANIAASWDVGILFASLPVTYQILGVGFNIDTSGTYNHTSDRRMKSEIKIIADGALDKVMKLVPSTFTLNEDPKKRVHAGLLAQDIQPVMPEAISVNAKDQLMTSDTCIIAYLVKAVQELEQEVRALRAARA